MNNIFKKKNNLYLSSELINSIFIKNINKENNLYNIKDFIKIYTLTKTNEFNRFKLEGMILRKKKKKNLNSSITLKMELSNIKIYLNFHPYSNSIILI